MYQSKKLKQGSHCAVSYIQVKFMIEIIIVCLHCALSITGSSCSPKIDIWI